MWRFNAFYFTTKLQLRTSMESRYRTIICKPYQLKFYAIPLVQEQENQLHCLEHYNHFYLVLAVYHNANYTNLEITSKEHVKFLFGDQGWKYLNSVNHYHQEPLIYSHQSQRNCS